MNKKARNELKWSRIGLLIITLVLIVVLVIYNEQGLDDEITLGTLGLSIYLAYFTVILPYLKRPRLEVHIGKPVCSPPHQANDTASWFVRLKVVNYGLTPARHCVGRLIGVWSQQGQQLQQLEEFDPLTLYWSRQDKSTGHNPIVIQGHNDFDYLDIAQVKRHESTPIELRVVLHPPMTLTKGSEDSLSPDTAPVLKAGTYFLYIGIYGEDAEAYVKPTCYKLTCSAAVPDCNGTSPCQISQESPSFAGKR